ncbi:hypothetical protein AAHB60_11190 [Pseudomonas aeruginosa]
MLQRPVAGSGSDQPAAEAQAVRTHPGVLRRRPARQDLRPLGPGLQAEHRRHARRAQPRTDGSALAPPARRCAPTIPKPCRKPSGSMATTNA